MKIALVLTGGGAAGIRHVAVLRAMTDLGLLPQFIIGASAGASKGKKSEFRIDHIEPVIPLTGFTNWDDVIRRLITGPHNLQVLCLVCHGVKSKAENAARRKHKKDLL